MSAPGAPNATNTSPGAIYVFRNYRGTWIPEERVVRSEPQDGSYFGNAILLRHNRLAGMAGAGVYVFERHGAQWVEIAKLVAPEFLDAIDTNDFMDWDGTNLVVLGFTHAWIFDLSSLKTADSGDADTEEEGEP